MGTIMTTAQAGTQYRFSLVWTLIPGVIGLIVYADMAGRVAIASGQTLFDVIRDRLGFTLALITLLTSLAVNTLTLVVELAGMSLALQVATRVSYLVWFPLAALLLAVILWRASFGLIENGSAILGLAMLIVVLALWVDRPPWADIGAQTIHPTLPSADSVPAYLFLAIALLGGYMTPSQFYFYSSGTIEDEWEGPDLLVNRTTSIIGSIFGGMIAFSLIVVTGLVLFPEHTQVNALGDVASALRESLGGVGWAMFLIGVFAVAMGAGLETALSGAYSACQYYGWDWGKRGKPRQAPLFALIDLAMLVAAVLIAYTRIDPIRLTVLTMVLAAASLPFTFLPLLITANDEEFMGEQKNTRPSMPWPRWS